MKKMKKTPLAAAMGTAIISTFAATAVQAEANPFSVNEMSAGYMQLAAAHEEAAPAAKEAEMKCGDKMKKPAGEGKCADAKCGEGKCAGKKAAAEAEKAKDAKCGENKCGEGKCAGNKAAPAAEKAEEAKCGEKKCGANK